MVPPGVLGLQGVALLVQPQGQNLLRALAQGAAVLKVLLLREAELLAVLLMAVLLQVLVMTLVLPLVLPLRLRLL